MLKVEKIPVVNTVHFLRGGELRSGTGTERCDTVIGMWTLHASAPVSAQSDSVMKEKDAFLTLC